MTMQIDFVEKPCRQCPTFDECKAIDETYRAQLEANGWNYRQIKVKGSPLKTPIRQCTDTIFKQYAPFFTGKDILEIGCSTSSQFTLPFIREQSIRYVGVEPRSSSPGWRLSMLPRRLIYKPYNVIAAKIINPLTSSLYNQIQRMKRKAPRAYYMRDRFPSPHLTTPASFDVIFASSSIEHWHEDQPGSSEDLAWNGDLSVLEAGVQMYQADIRRAYELLRPQGMLLIDCPIHVHGNVIFFRGFLDHIKRIFESVPWTSLTYESWRLDYSGLRPYLPDARRDAWKTVYKQPVENLWIFNVIARK